MYQEQEKPFPNNPKQPLCYQSGSNVWLVEFRPTECNARRFLPVAQLVRMSWTDLASSSHKGPPEQWTLCFPAAEVVQVTGWRLRQLIDLFCQNQLAAFWPVTGNPTGYPSDKPLIADIKNYVLNPGCSAPPAPPAEEDGANNAAVALPEEPRPSSRQRRIR
jgi:hypothetical protein